MRKVNDEQFNRMVFAILVKYSIFLQIKPSEIEAKITQFSEQSKEQNEKSIQHGQDDQTEQKPI
jgi:hypothetical protein